MRVYIQKLWKKHQQKKAFFWYEHVFFFFLCFVEFFYTSIFFIHQRLRRFRGQCTVKECTIISVGNISSGGTGKSVFVAFLVDILGPTHCAIVLRGYGRKRTTDFCLVRDGNNILASVDDAGDEAFMTAINTGCTVAVGKRRDFVVNRIMQRASCKPDYIILDDAYQNHALVVQYSIVLLDATVPIERTHCLPAGSFREKDLSRADVIIITHADRVSPAVLQERRQEIIDRGFCKPIFSVKHVLTSIRSSDGMLFKNNGVGCYIVCAGIGNISHFINNLDECGISVGQVYEFPDHYQYTQRDIDMLYTALQKSNFTGIITTEKDWVKLQALLHDKKDMIKKYLIASVSIEFLSEQEYSLFVDDVRKNVLR